MREREKRLGAEREEGKGTKTMRRVERGVRGGKPTDMERKKKEMSDNSQPREIHRSLETQGDEWVGLFLGHEAPYT